MEATLVALEVVAEPLKSMATILVDVCAYAGEFLHMYSHTLSERHCKCRFAGQTSSFRSSAQTGPCSLHAQIILEIKHSMLLEKEQLQ